MGMRSNTGGEIVEVEGGHIVRSTGRKDRHSKVYTAKGPRDRRVRLSAHTAIEFYDVQDRLGYDRPSKAVDWLIKKAKSSIDKLAELPPWHPSSAGVENTAQDDEAEEEDNNNNKNAIAGSSHHHHDMAIAEQSESNNGYNFHHSAFISTQQQQIETDPIANFFPTTSTNSSSINFQNYPHDIISRASNNPTEDNILGLSLHSFHQTGGGGANQAPSSNEHHQSTLFAGGSTDVVGGFEGNHHHYQKIVAWNTEEAAAAAAASMDNMNRVGGFLVNSQPFLGGHQSGTLQSSPSNLFSPSLRSWSEINPMNSSNSSEHHHRSQQQIHQASIFGSRFLSDGLAGFCIPARIQGEEENHGHGRVASNNSPSSASHNSHH